MLEIQKVLEPCRPGVLDFIARVSEVWRIELGLEGWLGTGKLGLRRTCLGIFVGPASVLQSWVGGFLVTLE